MTLLDELAGLSDADPATAPPPGELWDRGRRWHRRRRRGTALALVGATLLTAAWAGLGVERSRSTSAASSYDGAVGLPDRVYAVSPWLPARLPGSPVVAVESADRGGWWGSRPGLVAISATTGQYGFLDLPDYAGQGFALAPDGEHVAYWGSGEPSGDPNTADGQRPTVTGVAVYDTTTGEVARHGVATRHGLMPEGLVWADGATLLAGFAQWEGGDHSDAMSSMAGPGENLLWRLGQDPTSLPPLGDGGFAVVDNFTEAAGDLVVLADRGRLLLDLGTGRAGRVPLPAPPGQSGADGSSAALRADGAYAQVGGPGLGSRFPNRVTSAVVRAAGAPTDVRVLRGTSRTFQVLGWRDRDSVVLVRAESPSWDAVRVESVDVRTGEAETLVRYEEDAGLKWAWAGDVLDADPVPGVRPPSPLDPRHLWGGLALIALVTAASVTRWRHRVRP
ncbi:hypothetical protein [Nocardioides sp. P5_C9_2]